VESGKPLYFMGKLTSLQLIISLFDIIEVELLSGRTQFYLEMVIGGSCRIWIPVG
jgi:hypothetical protein